MIGQFVRTTAAVGFWRIDQSGPDPVPWDSPKRVPLPAGTLCTVVNVSGSQVLVRSVANEILHHWFARPSVHVLGPLELLAETA